MRSPLIIILVTMSLWNEPHRGRHHYAMVLSEKHKVLWVNRRLQWKEAKKTRAGIEKINDNLSVLHTGRSLLPGRIDLRVNWDNIVRLRILKNALLDIGNPDVVWIYDYKAIKFAEYFKGKATTLYFCNDYFGEFAYKQYEEKLAKLVNYVFATAPKLVDRLKPFNVNCTFLPHGVWLSSETPEFKKKAKPETVGYVGTLRNVIDTQFLRKIITETPCKLIIAGPIIECDKEKNMEFHALLSNENIIYLGNLARTQISQALNDIDISILPYISTFKTQHNFPIKIFDYLAAGKPIVATPYFNWPEPYSHYVNVYNNQKNIGLFLRDIYSKWDRKKFSVSLSLSHNCTWDQRARQVGEIIGSPL